MFERALRPHDVPVGGDLVSALVHEATLYVVASKVGVREPREVGHAVVVEIGGGS
jgi:hypothetical protein